MYEVNRDYLACLAYLVLLVFVDWSVTEIEENDALCCVYCSLAFPELLDCKDNPVWSDIQVTRFKQFDW